MKPPAMNLALKMAIHESRKTQKRIAALARMTEPRLSLIVRGREEPTSKERDRLAKALGKSQADIFSTAAPKAVA
jgi:transcriptional regulator with XRE-family HTH domain